MILSIFEEQGFVYPASAVQYRGRKQSGGEALLGLAASNWLVGRGEFCSSLRINSKAWQWDLQGGYVDQQLKQLMKELGEAINESLADSEPIADVVSRIKEGGYDIFLVLEATIGVSKPGEKSSDKTSLVTTLTSNPDFKISDQDLKFLKSLRIKIEDEAA